MTKKISVKQASGPFLKLTEELKKRAQELIYVKAFWIHGSRAEGKDVEGSNIDYAFIIDDQKNYNNLKHTMSDIISWRNVIGYYPEQHWEVAVWKEQQITFKDIGWHVFTEEEIQDIANIYSTRHESHKKERWLEPFQDTIFQRKQSAAQFFIGESVSLYDPHEILKKAKDKVKEYPVEVAKKTVVACREKLKKRLMWHGTPWIPRNKFHFIAEIREDLYYIAMAHYARTNILMINNLKRYEQDLPELIPDITKELNDLVRIDENFGKEDKSIPLRKIVEAFEK